MFFKRLSFNGDFFYFDLKKYENIKDPNEKIKSLINYLDVFNAHYTKNPITQKDKDKNKDIIDFFNILSRDYSMILNKSIKLVLFSIPFFCELLTDLPNIESIGELIDIMLDLICTEGDLKDAARESLRALFKTHSFCEMFITAKLSTTFIKLVKGEYFDRLVDFVELFKTGAFYAELAKCQPESTIFLPMNFIVGFRESGELMIPDDAFLKLIKFFIDTCCKGYGPSIIKKFEEDNFLERTNKLIIDFNEEDILSLYKEIACVDEEFPVHPKILKLMNNIYIEKANTRKLFLNFILDKTKEAGTHYTAAYVEALALQQWFVPEITTDIDMFKPYAELTKCVITVNIKYATPVVTLFFDSLIAPVPKNVLIDKICPFFCELIQEYLNPMTFCDSMFLKKVIIDPPIDDVAKLVCESKTMQNLIRLLFNEKRIGWHPKDLMQRIVDCTISCGKLELNDFVCEIIGSNFTPGILRFFVENIDNDKTGELFYTTLSPWRSDLVTMFKSADCFSIVEKKMNSKKWIIQFLTFINTIVLHENDHFFDEWMILQPKESPFFKLTKEEIRDLVLPTFPTDPIPIPSLAPLCDDFETESNFNLYLLGSYAIPNYTKLGFKLDSIVNIKLITSRFVRMADLEALLDTNVHFVSELLMQPIDAFPIFEFFPKHGPGFIEPVKNASVIGFAFSIRFDEEPVVPYHFLSFNNCFVGLCGDNILAPGDSEVSKIECHKWHTIIVYWDKYEQLINVLLDKKSLFSLQSDKPVVLDFIGNKNEPAPSFSVANSVTEITEALSDDDISNFTLPPTPTIELIPKMSCGLALYNAFSTIYSDDAQILRLFERFEKAETGKEDYLRIIAQIPDICDINVPLFFKNFLYSLKDCANDCQTGWCSDFSLSIFWVKDIKQRSEIFLSVLNDFEFWSIMPVPSLLEFLDSVKKYFKNHKDKIDYNLLISENCLMQLFYLIFSVSSQQLSDELIDLYVFFMEFAGPQEIKQTALLVKSSNVWSYLNQMDLDDNPLEPYILDFTRQSIQQSHFCLAIFNYEREHKTQVFSTETLLFLAYVTLPEAAIKILSCALSRQPDFDFMEENMSIICCAVQRFPLEVELWNFFFSRLCDTTVDINTFDKEKGAKLTCKKLIYIAPIFSMIISLFNQESHELFEKIITVFKTVFESQLSLLTQQQLPQLIHLISGGKRKIPDCEQEEFVIPETIKLSKTEQNILKTHVSSTFLRWQLNVDIMLNEMSIKQPFPDDFVDFVSSFLNDMIHEQSNDILTKSVRGIYIIAQYADLAIVKAFFLKYIQSTIKSSKKVMTAIADSLCYLYSKDKSIFDDEQLIQCAAKYCIENQATSQPFINFIIFSLPTETKMSCEEIIRIVSPRTTSLTMEQAIVLLNELIKRGCELSSPFFTDFAKRLRKVVSFSSTSSEESLRFESFVNSSSKLKLTDMTEENKADLKSTAEAIVSQNDQVIETIEADFSDIKKLVHKMYSIASCNSVIVWFNLRNFYTLLNYYLKSQEKFISFKYKAAREGISQTGNVEKTLSYRSSPFVLPMHCPTAVFPSPFPIFTPSDEVPEKKEPKTTIFGLKADFPVNLELYSYLPCKLFRFSGLFHAKNENLLPLFTQLYGNYTSMLKCRLIRLESKIPCVAFVIQKDIILLSGADIDENGGLKLLEVTAQNYVTFMESVLLGEYGKYGMFCGRFVIELETKHLLYIRQTNFCCHQFSREFFSASAGNFILEFYQQPAISAVDLIGVKTQEQITQEWIDGKVSNFDYLLTVNFFAERSFADLAAYPVFPRILMDFKGDSFGTIARRDLSKPVQIVADPDQTHKTLQSRFALQKFYHNENVSNPMIVSSLHVRLIPFCRYQWFINEGWDAGDRNFLAIPFHLSIGPKTMYEITPEMFAVPELLFNLNNFQLKNGTKFDIELPKWVNTQMEFIERHRSLVEAPRTRTKLNQWIDLIFGIKQNSKEDINVFHPLSYTNTQNDEDKIAQQQNWTEMCGQVPKQVFQAAHPQATSISSLNFVGITFTLNSHFTPEYRVSRGLCVLFHKDEKVLVAPELCTTLDISESENKLLFAFTLSVSIVRVFLTVNNQFIELSSLRVQSPTKTVLCDKEFVAITACDEELVFWSVASGIVIQRVPLRLVKALSIDHPTSTVFASSGSIVKQFTMSGTLIREFDVGKTITTILTFGFGYGIADRVIAIGLNDGIVKIYIIEENSLDPMMVREAKLTRGPIVRIIRLSDSLVLNVFNEQSHVNQLVL